MWELGPQAAPEERLHAHRPPGQGICEVCSPKGQAASESVPLEGQQAGRLGSDGPVQLRMLAQSVHVPQRSPATMAETSWKELEPLKEMRRIKSAHDAKPLAQCLEHRGLQVWTVTPSCAGGCARGGEGVGESTPVPTPPCGAAGSGLDTPHRL